TSSGSAAFLLPSTATRPCRRWPPSMSRVDINPRCGPRMPAATLCALFPRLQERHVRVVTEPGEYRFRPKRHPEPFEHGALDPRREPQHVACRRAAAIDDRERVLARQSHRAVCMATLESRALDQPGSRNLYAIRVDLEARRGDAGNVRDALAHARADNRIHEERAHAPRVRVAGVDN